MPAATSKADLITITEKEWEKLSNLLAKFDDAGALREDSDGLSAIRIVGHRAAWIELYFNWCKAAANGEEPEIPAPGYKWNQLKALNDEIFRKQQGWTWSAALEALKAAHAHLMDDISTATEAELYAAPISLRQKWTRGRYAEAAGASHYRSAAKALRKIHRAI